MLTDLKSRFIEMFGSVKNNDKGWKIVVMDSVTSSRLGKMLDKKQQTGKNLHKYLGNHNVKWFDFDFDSLSEMDFDDADQKEFSLQYGDVLMCEGGEVGRCAVWRCGISDCYYQKALHRIRCSNELNPFFLVQLFKQMADSGCLSDSTNTSTISHLTGVKLKKMTIILPPIELQEQYVNFIEQTDKSKVISESRTKSRFIEMFGSLDDNKYNHRIVELGDICEFIKDGTHQTPTYTDDVVNVFKFLSSKDVVTGRINWNDIKYIPPELHEELYSRLAPRRDDILLAKNGTTGIAAKVDTDEIFDIYVSLALLRPLPGNNVDFLVESINQPTTKRQFNARLKGIGVPNLHLGEIKKTKILLPPIEQQNYFVDFLKQVDKSKYVANKAKRWN